MNALVTRAPSRSLSPAQIRLVRETVAKDCTPEEFDLFMAQAQRAGLDPFRNEITALVFSKGSKDKRQMAIVTKIDGYRSLAARCGDYRPPNAPAEYVTDPDLASDLNPEGLVRAVVTCFKQYGPDWFSVIGEAYWDEFAPIKDEWIKDDDGRSRRSGKKQLSDTWKRMPRLMLAKVAEAQALRRGWPNQTGGLYVAEEMDKAKIIDATASEIITQHEEARRSQAVGLQGQGLTFSFDPNAPLERVPRGKLADRCMDYLRGASLDGIESFLDRNRESLRQFWAWEPNDALEVKQEAERRIASLRAFIDGASHDRP